MCVNTLIATYIVGCVCVFSVLLFIEKANRAVMIRIVIGHLDGRCDTRFTRSEYKQCITRRCRRDQSRGMMTCDSSGVTINPTTTIIISSQR